MTFALSLLTSRWGRYGLALVAVAGLVLWLRWDAVQDERRAREARDMRHHIETRQRIDDAIRDPRTPDDIRERLRRLAE